MIQAIFIFILKYIISTKEKENIINVSKYIKFLYSQKIFTIFKTHP